MSYNEDELVKQVIEAAKQIYGTKTPGTLSPCRKFIIPTADSAPEWLPEKIEIPTFKSYYTIINPKIKEFESLHKKLERRQNEGVEDLSVQGVGVDMMRVGPLIGMNDIDDYLDIRREVNNAPINTKSSIRPSSGYFSIHVKTGPCQEEQLRSSGFNFAKQFADICFHATRDYEAVLKKSDMGVPLTEEDHIILNSLPLDEYLRLKAVESNIFAVPKQNMDVSKLLRIADKAKKRYNKEEVKPTGDDLYYWPDLSLNLAKGDRIDEELAQKTYNHLFPHFIDGQKRLHKKATETMSGLKDRKSIDK